MTTAPLPLDEARREPRAWLASRPLWTDLAIVAMWTAVAIDALAGPDLVSRSGDTVATVPSAVIVAVLAAVATIFVARYGFAPEQRDAEESKHGPGDRPARSAPG